MYGKAAIIPRSYTGSMEKTFFDTPFNYLPVNFETQYYGDKIHYQ